MHFPIIERSVARCLPLRDSLPIGLILTSSPRFGFDGHVNLLGAVGLLDSLGNLHRLAFVLQQQLTDLFLFVGIVFLLPQDLPHALLLELVVGILLLLYLAGDFYLLHSKLLYFIGQFLYLLIL